MNSWQRWDEETPRQPKTPTLNKGQVKKEKKGDRKSSHERTTPETNGSRGRSGNRAVPILKHIGVRCWGGGGGFEGGCSQPVAHRGGTVDRSSIVLGEITLVDMLCTHAH